MAVSAIPKTSIFNNPTDRKSLTTSILDHYNAGGLKTEVFIQEWAPSPVAGSAPNLEGQIKDGVDFFSGSRSIKGKRISDGVNSGRGTSDVNVAGQGKQSTTSTGGYTFSRFKTKSQMVDYDEPALQNNADASWYTKGLGGVVPKYGVEPAFTDRRGNSTSDSVRMGGQKNAGGEGSEQVHTKKFNLAIFNRKHNI